METKTKTEVKATSENNNLLKLAGNLVNKLKTQAKTPAEKKALQRFVDTIKNARQLKIEDLAKLIAQTLPKSLTRNLQTYLSAYPKQYVEKLTELVKIETFKTKFNKFLTGLDKNARTKYMSPGNKRHLLTKYGRFFKEGEKGYPLQTTINGKKWYVTDATLDVLADAKKMLNESKGNAQLVKQIKQVIEQLKRKVSLHAIYLIDPQNPLIQVSFEFKEFKKNPQKTLQEKAKLAKKEWKEQKENESKLRKFDLPKGPRIAYLSLYPGYMSVKHPHHSPDPAMKKNQHVTEMQPAILRQNGYNIEKSKITYTDKPEEVIKKKLEELRRAKPPIKHIVLNITTHGLDKASGGGSKFIGQAPDRPKELPGKVVEVIKINRRKHPKFSAEDLLKKYYFKSEKLTAQQNQQLKKYLKLWAEYNQKLDRFFSDADKTNRLHGDELVKICRANKDIKFFIKSSSCYGGDFARYFKKANLPNVVLSLAAQPYHVASSAVAREKTTGRTLSSTENNNLFYTKALMHMGKTLEVPQVVNGKMQFDANGKPKMTRMKIKTIGDALYYADIMSAHMGSLDDPETIIPKR